MAPISWPSKVMRPSDLSIRRMTMVEVVDLPQPDSPTRPTLSPRSTLKLMPSTARNVSGSGEGPRRMSLRNVPTRPSRPLRGYSLTSFCTVRSGARSSPLDVNLGVNLGVSLATTDAGAADASSSGNRSRSDMPGRGVARISLRV